METQEHTGLSELQIAVAVRRFARRECGLKDATGLVALRVTGDTGLGGVWQCYVPFERSCLNSIGPNIHATSDGVCEKRDPR